MVNNFLAEQIESIQKQTVSSVTLYIRDDGSSDTTPEIISNIRSLIHVLFLLMLTTVKILVLLKTFIPF